MTEHRGTCPLCLKEKDLRESHYMPAALYPKNAKELVFTTQEAAHADRFEVNQYLLCFDCEQRFSNNGESEVLRLVSAKLVPRKPHEFPLMELLTAKTPFANSVNEMKALPRLRSGRLVFAWGDDE